MIQNQTGWRSDNSSATRVVERKMARLVLSGEYLSHGEPIAADVPDRGTLIGVNVWPRWSNGTTFEWNGSKSDPRIVVIVNGVPLNGGDQIVPPAVLHVETISEIG